MAALLGAGLRLSSRVAPRGLERVLSAATLAAALAVAEAILLGLVGAGSDPLALSGAALITWAVTLAWLPSPDVPLRREAAESWRAASTAQRMLLGALVGAGAAWAAWLFRHPAYGFDGVTYHIPEIVAWVQSGRPGSVVDVLPGIPVGNYPLTGEVMLAWGSGIARSFGPLTLWPVAMLGVLVSAAWLGLRTLRVSGGKAALAIAALVSAPVLMNWNFNGPGTDTPALAWLVTAAALTVLATRREEPALMAPALVAAALAVGTKPTMGPLAVAVVIWGLWSTRRRLSGAVTPLVLGAVLGIVAGGVWYLRNVLDHGSPLWPYLPTPWSDPKPLAVERIDDSFVDHPGRTLDAFGNPDYVAGLFVGGLVVLAGAMFMVLLARRASVAVAAAAAGVCVLVWMNGPATGIVYERASAATFATLRFLLPAIAAATLALALATRAGRARVLAIAVLSLVLAVNLVQLFDLGSPEMPAPWAPLAGAAAGAALAATLGARLPIRALLHPVAAASGAAVAGMALGVAAAGLIDRHRQLAHFDAGLISWFSGPADDKRPIAMAPYVVGMLTGDRLDRPVQALGRRAPCSVVRRHATEGWLVVSTFESDDIFGPSSIDECLREAKPVHATKPFRVYDLRPGTAAP